VDSFTNSMDVITGKADWVVACPGGRVPETLVPLLLKHPAVQAASPLLTTYVRATDKKAEPFLLIGLDPILDRSLHNWKTEEAASVSAPAESAADSRRISRLDLLSKPYTMIIGGKLAEQHHLAAGDSITLEHVQQQKAFHVLGTLAPRGLALVDGGIVALTDIATFQEFTGLEGVVDRIDLVLKPTAGSAAPEELRALLPDGIVLEQPGESRETGRRMIGAYQLNLSVLSFVSLFVGMFLVYSMVALHASSRRHELAVLRSLGASSRLLFFLFLAEGAFFGVVGWITAIPLGSFMVKQLLGRVSATITHLFVRVQVDRLTLEPLEIALSFFITVAISMLAAFRPAREAMNVPPREALLMLEDSPSQQGSVKKASLTGLVLIALVWPLAQLPETSGVPLSGYLATFFLFAGFSLLSPWLLKLMGTCLPPVLRHLGGEPAYLAGRYVRDSGTRIAISVGALITAIALFVALSIMVHSFRETVRTWVYQSISGDLFLRPKLADINHYRDPVSPEVVTVLKRLEARTGQPQIDLLPYRRIFLRYGGKFLYQFEAIDFDAFLRTSKFLLLEGRPEEIFPGLARAEGVLVSEVFANQTGLTVGSHFRSHVEGAVLDLPILGIFRDYRTQGGVVHYSLPHFVATTRDTSWSGVRIDFRDLRDSEAKSAAIRLRGEIFTQAGPLRHTVEITVGEDLRREILRIFDETFAITTVLLLIALLVAALGITTTLTVLVLERTRQLHTLLAGGAARGQIRAMILWEAILMVLAGECVGLVCGFLLSYLLIFVINRQSFGWTFIYSIDWGSLWASLPLILLTALLASLPAGQLVFSRSPAAVLRER